MGRGAEIHGWRGLACACLTAAALAAGAAPATAAPVLDVQCGPPDGPPISPIPNQRIAQTFMAQTTGLLVEGRMVINKPAASTGDWVMQVYAADGAGNPTNTALATTGIPNGTVPDGESTVSGVFPAPASVQAGQVYALSIFRSNSHFVRARSAPPNPCPGAIFASNSLAGPWFPAISPDIDLVFSVFVEPTPTPTDPADTTPPDTTISEGPSGKSKSKSATFGFSGTDARAVASFQCRLDSGSFETCTSPKTYSGLKKGSHTFEVRAVGPAGNVDPTPASRSWTVKRKKKKK